MHIDELQNKLGCLLKEVGELTQQDVGGIENIILQDGKKCENTETDKLFERSRELYEEYGFYENINPVGWVKRASNYIAFKGLAKFAALMIAEDKKTISIFCEGEKPNLMTSFLVHELTHLVDFNYNGVFDKRKKLFEEILDLSKETLKAKHEKGLIGGYIKKTKKVKDLETQIKAKENEIRNFMAVVESHAMYIQDKWNKRHNVILISGKLLLKALATLPLYLIPSIRKKGKQYSIGVKLVKEAYARGVPIKTLYDNIPSEDDFKNTNSYMLKVTTQGDEQTRYPTLDKLVKSFFIFSI